MKSNNIILLSIFLPIMALAEPKDQNKVIQKVTTVFAPGFTAPIGGSDKYKPAFSSSADCSEITTFPDQQKPEGLFSRMIARMAKRFSKDQKHVNRESHMGQKGDIRAIQQHMNNNNKTQKPTVLYGICKSGSALINYVARYNPANVQAIVLDAAPADIVKAMRPKFAKAHVPAFFDGILFRLMFPNYPKHAQSPISVIKDIKNKEMGILIVHSKDDTIIPFAQALQLYATFKKYNFKHVYLVTLHGQHAGSMENDQKNYLTALHTFYKELNLEHNPEYATGNMNDYCYDLKKAQAEIKRYHRSLS